MRRILGISLVLVLASGILALVAPATEAGGPKVCPKIGCDPCAVPTKVPGEKCPVCVPIPDCTP